MLRTSLTSFRGCGLLFVAAGCLLGGATARAAVLAVPGDYPTIQLALDAAGPGDTVEVAPGVYFEKLVFHHGGSAQGGFLTLRAVSGRPVLDGTGVAGSDMILIESQSYVRVSGFEIRNNLGVKDGSGIRVTGSGRGIELLDNVIHDIRGKNAMAITVYGTKPDPIDGIVIRGNQIYDCEPAPSEALTLNGNVVNFEVSDNLIRDVNNIGIDLIGGETDIQPDPQLVARTGVVRGNTVIRARAAYGGGFAAGIYVDGGRDIVIENNLVRESDLGIEVGAENPGIVATGVVVRNNVVAENDKAGIVFGGYDASVGRADGNLFQGNTLYHNNRLGRASGGEGEIWVQWAGGNTVRHNLVVAGPEGVFISSYQGSTNNQFDYNLYYYDGDPAAARFELNDIAYSGFPAWQAGTGQDGNSLYADPLLVAPAAGDFHLTSTSPAVDAGWPGFSAAAGETDLDGGPRQVGAGVDIGADEFACGNGIVDPGELCDDGNLVSGDGCDANCTPTGCGNGIVTAGEQCDDGNQAGGDCCAPDCTFEPAGSACDDGLPCTRGDACDGGGTCTAEIRPAESCLVPSVPHGSRIRLRRPPSAAKRRLVWRWAKGPALEGAAFGDPTEGTDYTLCVYASESGLYRLLVASTVTAGSGWSAWPGKPGGFRYRDRGGTKGGTVRVDLRPGPAGKGRVVWKAKGPRLSVGELPVAASGQVVTELDGAEGGCLAASFSVLKRNEAGKLMAASD
ncbi:MAG: DUF4215 domain-containing protein [Candidatus Dadabacteria bacterium]|nr:MAG: DUF4215 domain-containing protein [Candidatus Dadabacteria bacterium]